MKSKFFILFFLALSLPVSHNLETLVGKTRLSRIHCNQINSLYNVIATAINLFILITCENANKFITIIASIV